MKKHFAFFGLKIRVFFLLTVLSGRSLLISQNQLLVNSAVANSARDGEDPLTEGLLATSIAGMGVVTAFGAAEVVSDMRSSKKTEEKKQSGASGDVVAKTEGPALTAVQKKVEQKKVVAGKKAPAVVKPQGTVKKKTISTGKASGKK
ncbi:hypothetical protein FJ366_01455 [Candidatus Dependentiae bacterium]|nr:hypothetical protein [Candidatus Dependentiae bacterium]